MISWRIYGTPKQRWSGLALRSMTRPTAQVAKAIFVCDLGGNGTKLYVDASDVWKEEAERMLEMASLDL